jgi:hypothetical protein
LVSLQAERTADNSSSQDLFFDINAKLEEQKRNSDMAILAFELSITTKPNVVKYAVRGAVTLEGSSQDIKKKLEVNPKTKIPQILFTVYQHAFSSIYMLSSILNVPYPPPDLLHPMQERIQILPPAAAKSETVTVEKEQEVPVTQPSAGTAATTTASTQ